MQRTREAVSFWTYEGWLYLAVVLDLFSRRVIGWAMAATQDETLIETTLRMALLARRPAAELLLHSDRRSQYTSDAYRAVLAQAAISVSMSSTGNRYDNAVTESFFGTLKRECCKSQHETSGSGLIILVAFGFLGLPCFLLIELERLNELSSFLKTAPLHRPE